MTGDIAHYRVDVAAPTLAPRAGPPTGTTAPAWAMIEGSHSIPNSGTWQSVVGAAASRSLGVVGILEPTDNNIMAMESCVAHVTIMMKWGGWGGGSNRSMRAEWTAGLSSQLRVWLTSPDDDLYDMGASSIYKLNAGDDITPQFWLDGGTALTVDWTMTFILLEDEYFPPGG